jgi:hypothetical protein
MSVSLANPFLILIWSMAMLLLGCAIGLYWKAAPGTALCVAAFGALLMVIHDLVTGVLWFWVTAKMVGQIQNRRPS